MDVKEHIGQFNEKSYERHHNWYNIRYPEKEQKVSVIETFKNYSGSINHWLQQFFFKSLIPFLDNKSASWLTVGDGYGHDARFLLENGIKNVTATDLNADFLQIAQELGFINDYAIQNAEKLSYESDSIDYLLCKESYHHFPRPYAALYEMIRVAKKGIIIIEPQDPIAKMPFLLFLSNLVKADMVGKIWKNRFSYEPVGNYVYKVSEREFEKFAAALNLPLVAVKKINPHYWFSGCDKIPAKITEKSFRRILFKKKVRDLITRIGLLPSQVLSVVVFKESPDDKMLSKLKENGYKIIKIPANPYL